VLGAKCDPLRRAGELSLRNVPSTARGDKHMTERTKSALVWAVVSLIAPSLLMPQAAVSQIENTHRDEWQNVTGIFAAMDIKQGDRVADVGCGGGFLTLRLSEAVGPDGVVYGEDIRQSVLEELEGQLRFRAIDNVELILGDTDDPNLPEAMLDAVLIVNAYHEMTEFESMLSGIMRALEPGGRLVIVDNPPNDSTASRSRQVARHDIALRLVEQDLLAAGFAILERHPNFIDERDGRHHHEQWMLVAVNGSEHP
jgi:SAM-dependent methyltransferase